MGGIEGRKAHQPVDALFGAQVAVGIFAIHRDGHALDPGFFAFGHVQNFGLETAPFDPAQVHAFQHGGPIVRIGAAHAGIDGQQALP